MDLQQYKLLLIVKVCLFCCGWELFFLKLYWLFGCVFISVSSITFNYKCLLSCLYTFSSFLFIKLFFFPLSFFLLNLSRLVLFFYLAIDVFIVQQERRTQTIIPLNIFPFFQVFKPLDRILCEDISKVRLVILLILKINLVRKVKVTKKNLYIYLYE